MSRDPLRHHSSTSGQIMARSNGSGISNMRGATKGLMNEVCDGFDGRYFVGVEQALLDILKE